MPLNFLPTEDKEKFAKEQKLLTLKKNSTIFLALVVLAAAIIWSDLWILDQHNNSLEDSIAELRESQTIKETTTIESQIKDFNTKVRLVDDIITNRLPLSNNLSQLITVIPDGISVEKMFLNIAENNFDLRGIARDRDSYLALKDSLLSTGWFTEVDLPITDLLSRDTITFSLQTTFSDDFLTTKDNL